MQNNCTATNKENDNGNHNISNANDTCDKESDTDIIVLEVRDSHAEKVNAENKEDNMG